MKKLNILLVMLLSMFICLPVSEGAESASITYEQAVDMAVSKNYSLKNAEMNIERSYEVRKDASDNSKYTPLGPGNSTANKAFTGLVQADIAWQMSKKDYEMMKDGLTYSVKQSYNAVLQAMEKKKIADMTEKNAYWQNRIAEFKYQAGMMSSLERLSANSNHRSAGDNKKAAEKALEDSYQKFNQLIGISIDSRPDLTTLPEFKKMEGDSLETHVSRILSESNSVWLANQQINIAKLNLDLYTFNVPGAEPYDAKKIDVAKSENTAADTKEQLAKAIRSLYYSIRQMEDQHGVLQANLVMAEESLKITRVKHNIGMATQAELISAELAVEQIKQQIFDITAQHDNLVMAYKKPWVYSGGGK